MNRAEALKVLGLSGGESEIEIKKAYSRAQRRHHPDLGGSAENFHLVQLAYEVVTSRQGREVVFVVHESIIEHSVKKEFV